MPFDVRGEADLKEVDEHLTACVNAAVKAPRVLNVAEILALKVSKPESLIDGILPAAGASLIVGAPKSGKAEQQELTEHDALAKRTGCAILLIHHTSKGSAGLDWSEKAAGTFAMSAATESQINISRFAEMDIAAPERLVRIRGRHSEDLE